MSDELFPSGPWTGFYNYGANQGKHRMDLHLNFSSGTMTGDGHDDVGKFLIKGRYDSASLECYWTKTYPASHDVFYRGFREGKGIWGQWEIGVVSHGGFHIWPRRAGEGEEETRAEAEPIDAIGTEAREAVVGAAATRTPTGARGSRPFSGHTQIIGSILTGARMRIRMFKRRERRAPSDCR